MFLAFLGYAPCQENLKVSSFEINKLMCQLLYQSVACTSSSQKATVGQ